MSLGCTPEKHTMRHYNSHNAIFCQMVNHMLHKGKICLGRRRKFSVFTESVISHKQGTGTPFCRKWRVRHNCLCFQFFVLRVFQRIFQFNIESGMMNAMQYHIHSAQVVSGAVKFLPVKFQYITNSAQPKDKRT